MENNNKFLFISLIFPKINIKKAFPASAKAEWREGFSYLIEN